MKRIKKFKSQSGTQIAELALVTPFLLLLAVMLCEGGAMVRTHQVINNAAREGAHLSAQIENRCLGDAVCLNAIRQSVVDYAGDNGVTLTIGQVEVNQSSVILQPSGIGISASKVTVTLPYALPITSKLGSGIPATVNLGGSAEFRNFY